jgi:membrane fusion protein
MDARARILAAEAELVARRHGALLRLGERGHVARQQLDLVEQERLQLEFQAEQLRAARLELADEQARMEERQRALPGLKALRFNELDDRAGRLEREQAEISLQWRFVLRAPMAGRIAALGVEPGDSVRPGRTLLTLLAPDARMQAILLVPSRAAGFIEPGQSVRLRYAAFPHARFGSQPGEVVSVSHSVLTPAQVAPPGQAEEPVYKVRVLPEADVVLAYGRPLPLQAGMALEADVVLERRRLVHWLFDPMLALRGRL